MPMKMHKNTEPPDVKEPAFKRYLSTIAEGNEELGTPRDTPLLDSLELKPLQKRKIVIFLGPNQKSSKIIFDKAVSFSNECSSEYIDTFLLVHAIHHSKAQNIPKTKHRKSFVNETKTKNAKQDNNTTQNTVSNGIRKSKSLLSMSECDLKTQKNLRSSISLDKTEKMRHFKEISNESENPSYDSPITILQACDPDMLPEYYLDKINSEINLKRTFEHSLVLSKKKSDISKTNEKNSIYQENLKKGTQLLYEFAKKACDQQILCETFIIVTSETRQSLIDFSLTKNPSLLIIGIREKKGVVRAFRANFATTCIRRSNCPVMTIRI